MNGAWFERLLESIADRGRELLNLSDAERSGEPVESLCRALIAGRGEASAIALSREILHRYERMDAEARLAFFLSLHRDFGPSPEAVQQAVDAWIAKGGADEYLALNAAVEAPRQELLRRLNMAPQATGRLLGMRADLLRLLPENPELKDVDADFRHLLYSWFNRGFLELQSIDWHTPADILERLIRYEAVHAIRGWEDLRRRLAADRRCFAFFHPAVPHEPLIFVEVALVRGIAGTIDELIDPAAEVLDIRLADTAMFYSISNTQVGLRGVSFGSFLIKQVLGELRMEFPWLRNYATLSPLPGFARTVRAALKDEDATLRRREIEALLGPSAEAIRDTSGCPEPGDGLLALLAPDRPAPEFEPLSEALERLALVYLTRQRPDGRAIDPVAAFHLSNGARLERINPFADASDERRSTSFGVMVNYLYEPDEVEANHERYTGSGEFVMSRELNRALRRARGLIDGASQSESVVPS